jgi:hypothetical protein
MEIHAKAFNSIIGDFLIGGFFWNTTIHLSELSIICKRILRLVGRFSSA